MTFITDLLHTIQQAESGGEEFPDEAKGLVGELGRYQIKPSTAREFGLNLPDLLGDLPDSALHQESVSTRIATRILEAMVQRFGEQPEILLAAWNGGITAAINFVEKGVPLNSGAVQYAAKALGDPTVSKRLLDPAPFLKGKVAQAEVPKIKETKKGETKMPHPSLPQIGSVDQVTIGFLLREASRSDDPAIQKLLAQKLGEIGTPEEVIGGGSAQEESLGGALFGGERHGGQTFGGSTFGGQTFGGNRFGASAPPNLSGKPGGLPQPPAFQPPGELFEQFGGETAENVPGTLLNSLARVEQEIAAGPVVSDAPARGAQVQGPQNPIQDPQTQAPSQGGALPPGDVPIPVPKPQAAAGTEQDPLAILQALAALQQGPAPQTVPPPSIPRAPSIQFQNNLDAGLQRIIALSLQQQQNILQRPSLGETLQGGFG